MQEVKSESELREILREMASKKSVLALSKDLGFSQVFLYKVINDKRRVSPNLAKKLGFKSLSGTFKKL